MTDAPTFLNTLTTARPVSVFLDNRQWPYRVTLRSLPRQAIQPASGSPRLLYFVTAAIEAAHACLQRHPRQPMPSGDGYEIGNTDGLAVAAIDPRIVTPDRLRAVWPALVEAFNACAEQHKGEA
ncbi:hypothetical protein [Kerstersia similis]|uniref:hypothetical protein n=1 Tax=Kerstersia similis TaxID=206505 RepID=UPI0039EE8586